MSQKEATCAELLSAIPSNRYRIILENTQPPKKGDIVTLDQGFTDIDGKEMILVYCNDEKGTSRYEAEVYENELGPNLYCK
jgi:hypothetical protein